MIEVLLLVVGWMALVVVVVTWPDVPTGLRDAWRGIRSERARRRVSRAFVDGRPWAVGDTVWHHDARVEITHLYPQERLARVKDGLGIEYPVMLSDLRHQRVRRAA